MIYIDISEPEKVKKACKERFGENCQVKELGAYECLDQKIPLRVNGMRYCASTDEYNLLLENENTVLCRDGCEGCRFAEYTRFADFEIGDGRAFIERKSAPDFLSSRRDRLYSQLNKIDKFVEGRKILLLEGTKRVNITDSARFFSNYDKEYHDLRGMSPLEQVIDIAGNKEWTLSFIRECFMRDIWFLQAWDLDETIELLDNMDKGFDQDPKLRLIVKNMPEFPIQQKILAQIKGIGKVLSAKLLDRFGTLEQLVLILKEASEEDLSEPMMRKLHDAFIKKPKKVIK